MGKGRNGRWLDPKDPRLNAILERHHRQLAGIFHRSGKGVPDGVTALVEFPLVNPSGIGDPAGDMNSPLVRTDPSIISSREINPGNILAVIAESFITDPNVGPGQ